MDNDDDEDVLLVRASGALLADLEASLPHVLWKPTNGTKKRVHQAVRKTDLEHVLGLIEPFQGDPQLLDSKLKVFLPPIVEAFTAFLKIPQDQRRVTSAFAFDVALSKILYTFCKVRGEKIVAGFLSNEPRYIDLILSALEGSSTVVYNAASGWELNYILLVWLSHLLLAPFDLASITAPRTGHANPFAIDTSKSFPSLVHRVLNVTHVYIHRVTKEQEAAAKLLVRLAGRPDMQKESLASHLIPWALTSIERISSDPTTQDVSRCIGPLRFLAGLVSSPLSDDVARSIPSIYSCAQGILVADRALSIRNSAIIRKLCVKILRSVGLLSCRSSRPSLSIFFEEEEVLEQVIDTLIQILSDQDTSIRFAASKAISVLIVEMDAEAGHQVIDAVLDSFNVDLQGSWTAIDFSLEDPVKWHGLTLTVAQSLFRRSANTEQLPQILSTLLLALNFDHRAVSGASLGTNVRDAACFGLWSLARRYTTAELSSVKMPSIMTSHKHTDVKSVIEIIAIELIVAACLDPAGNVRRGCSAALQETVGRHPNEVAEGIALVQVIHYQAVGLRRRAIFDVAVAAAGLDNRYRSALLDGLRHWRGISSNVRESREFAGQSIGHLCTGKPFNITESAWTEIIGRLDAKRAQYSVEDRQGAYEAMSSILSRAFEHIKNEDTVGRENILPVARLWQAFETELDSRVLYTPRALKAGLPASLAKFIAIFAKVSASAKDKDGPRTDALSHMSHVVATLLNRGDEDILAQTPSMTSGLLLLQEQTSAPVALIDFPKMLQRLPVDGSKSTLHGAGQAIALGKYLCDSSNLTTVAVPTVRVLQVFAGLLHSPSIEWRVVSLNALQLSLHAFRSKKQHQTGSDKNEQSLNTLPESRDLLVHSLILAMQDRTINERGDVGSLVRIAATEVISDIWRTSVLDGEEQLNQDMECGIMELCLDKLDKVRLLAARCLQTRQSPAEPELTDVFSQTYFRRILQPMGLTSTPPKLLGSLVRGCTSCAGVAHDLLLQAARAEIAVIVAESDDAALFRIMEVYKELLKEKVEKQDDPQATLEFGAFVVETFAMRLAVLRSFSWRTLLSLVQKSHFKSSIVPKILSAINLYRGLAGIPDIREPVLTKLVSMAKTSPFARVRVAAAETLWSLTGAVRLKTIDFNRPPKTYSEELVGVGKEFTA